MRQGEKWVAQCLGMVMFSSSEVMNRMSVISLYDRERDPTEVMN